MKYTVATHDFCAHQHIAVRNKEAVMQPMPQLLPLLKQLRLSGMLDSLEMRAREAIEEKLSHTEFLALLLGDELARRDQQKFAQRQRRAGINIQKTMETFDFLFNPKVDQQKLRELATCRFLAEKAPVLLMGPCGTGKSHLAQALGHHAIRQGHDVLFVSQAKMLAYLSTARATGGYERKLLQYIKADLLIIDDFGLKPMCQGQDEDFHDIIAERYERRATLITSNLHLEEWEAAFQNKVLAAATVDRLRHGAYCVILDGKSYRSPRHPAVAGQTKN
jgi:DNA replication protein DnaC